MVLILAYGNTLRRDDGAGFVLVNALERMLSEEGLEVERIDSHQLEPELALDISGEKISAVLFIDTRALPETPVDDNLRVQFRRVVSAKNASPGTGHHLAPPSLLAYCRLLFKKEPPAWLVTVPGKDFDHGEGLSETTRKAINLAPEILTESDFTDGWWDRHANGLEHFAADALALAARGQVLSVFFDRRFA